MHTNQFLVVDNKSFHPLPSNNGSVQPYLTGVTNSTYQLTYEEEQSILEGINKEKATLLAPAIFYSVFLMIIGIVGNPVAIYIYGWRWQNTTTRVFLFWLACLDLLNCVITMPTEIFVLSSFYYFPNAGFCRLSRFFTYVINNSTSAVFLAIAWDRYNRICHPHRQAMSIFRSKVACGVSLLIGTAVSWPALFLYGQKVVPIPHPRGYVRGIMCNIRNDMDDTPYPLAFFIYLWCAVCCCVLILAGCYILIGRVILKRRRQKKMKKEGGKLPTEKKKILEQPSYNESAAIVQDPRDEASRRKLSARTLTPVETSVELKNNQPQTTAVKRSSSIDSNAEMTCADLSNFRFSGRRIRPPKSTLMLFAITAVFVLSFLPFLIITIIRQTQGPTFYPSLHPVQEVLVNIFLRFYLLNNCTNPVVYGLCNSQFRQELKKMFRVPALRRDSSMSRAESNEANNAAHY